MSIFGKSQEEIDERTATDAARRARIIELRDQIRRQKTEREVLSSRLELANCGLSKALSDHTSSFIPNWEYKLIDDADESTVNAFGEKGWELVGIASFNTGGGIGGNSIMKVHCRYAFKRLIPLIKDYPPEITALWTSRDALSAELVATDAEISAASDEMAAL